MACRIFGDKPLFKTILAYFQLYRWEKNQLQFESYAQIFIQENYMENVLCKTAVICPSFNVFNY